MRRLFISRNVFCNVFLCGVAVLICLALNMHALAVEPKAAISPAEKDADGFLTHRVVSPQQTSETKIRVLLPDHLNFMRTKTDGAHSVAAKKKSQTARGKTPKVHYPVIYVLPVEAKDGSQYGDGLTEIKKHDLHNRCEAIFVAPSFSELPWYADHPTNARIRQESYFVHTVVPFIEQAYPAVAAPEGRLLLGFSKSGWGAWSLLLRHPDFFGRAAAWDAPLMMHSIGKYGNKPIFGTQKTFAAYRITDLLRTRAAILKATKSKQPARLILIDQGAFHEEHRQVRQLMLDLEIPHEYHPGPKRRHDWRSGWVPIAVALLAPCKTANH